MTLSTKPTKIITPRQKEILHLIAQEYSTKEIASKLYLSMETVTCHRQNIKRNLNVKNTAGMIRVAFEKRIFEV